MKLQDILNRLHEDTSFSDNESSWYEDDEKKGLTEDQKKILINELKKFNEYGKAVYREANLKEVAKKVEKLSEYADTYLTEVNKGFDAVTINRNMKELRKYVNEFKKACHDVQEQQERMSALYEDIGLIFNRYFEIEDPKDEDSE